MKQKRADPIPVLADALRSLAVATAVVFLVHLVFWVAAHGVTADELDDPAHMLGSD